MVKDREKMYCRKESDTSNLKKLFLKVQINSAWFDMSTQYRTIIRSPMERARIYREREDIAVPALFLDRDGVIMEEKHYLKSAKDVVLIDGAADMLRKVDKIGYPIIVITNQSGISRGYLNWDDYRQVTDKLVGLLNTFNSSPLTAIYANSYGPNACSKS